MKLPKAESPGEAAFALHCRAEKLEPVREHIFDPHRKWRFDFAFLDTDKGIKLAVEIEGGVWTNGRHSRGAGMESDMEKYAEAAVMGWRVLRFSTQMVLSGYAIDCVLRIIRQ